MWMARWEKEGRGMAMEKRQYLGLSLESGRDGLITFFIQIPRRRGYLGI